MTCVNQSDGKVYLPRLKPAAMIDFIVPPDKLMMVQIIQAINCAADKIFTHRNSFLIIGDLSPLAAMYRAIRNQIPRFISVHFAHIRMIIFCALLVGVILSYVIKTDNRIQENHSFALEKRRSPGFTEDLVVLLRTAVRRHRPASCRYQRASAVQHHNWA